MVDPVTVGGLVASALGMAGDAVVKGAVGEAVKDIYKALKSKIAPWAGAEVEAMEKAPTSPGRRAVVAELIDAQPADATTALRPLAEQLIAALQAVEQISRRQSATRMSVAVSSLGRAIAPTASLY